MRNGRRDRSRFEDDSDVRDWDGVRMSHTNPPASSEDAFTRLVLVESDLGRIQSQIELTAIDDYPTDADYYSWQRKATAAHGYCRGEREFIVWWLYTRPIFEQKLKELGLVVPSPTKLVFEAAE